MSVRAITCTKACRNKRSLRLRREAKEAAAASTNPVLAEMRLATNQHYVDVAKEVLREQLQPIVRQTLTEDVLRAINDLVGLTPAAVAALHEDLESEDKVLRQRAYSLLMKYTVGHQALVKQEDTEDKSQLVVNFNLPRPDSTAPLPEEAAPPAIVVCDICKEPKPDTEMVAGSDRCQTCFDEWKAKIVAEFAS